MKKSETNLLNKPVMLALQVVNAMLQGGTGAGKTASARAIAAALGREFHHMNAATCLPEDFSGFPTPDHEQGVVHMMPPAWVAKAKPKPKNMTDKLMFILVDEVTSANQGTQAGSLTMLSDNIVGDAHLDDRTIRVGACNPLHLAANATNLAASVRNRFFWWDWIIDNEHLFAGFENGCQWESAPFDIVPVEPIAAEDGGDGVTPEWELGLQTYGMLVANFLRSAPDFIEQMPEDDLTLAFPSPRTWHYVARCLAAASACGYEDGGTMSAKLVKGCVGSAASIAMMEYIKTNNLFDPAAILDGAEDYKFQERADVNLALINGMISQLRIHSDEDRWSRCGDVLHTIATSGHIECSLSGVKRYLALRPKGFAGTKVIQKLSQILKA